MIPAPPGPAQQPSKQEIEQMIDHASMAWADAFNQNLSLTVQALQHLELAMEGKFTR